MVYRQGTTAVTGLVDGRTYFAIVDASDPTRIKLAATYADATAFSADNDTALAISGGSGSHSLASASADAVKGGASRASTSVSANSPTSKITGATGASETAVTSGTTAFIGANNTVTALGSIDLDARDKVDMRVVSGGVGVGGAGFGASVIVVTVDRAVGAEVRGGSILSAGTGAGQGVFIDGKLDLDFDGLAFAGGFGGIVGIAGGVVVFNDTSDVSAGLADATSDAAGVQITQAGTVAIRAVSDVTVRASALGVGASFFAGAGASVVVIDADGSATARVGDFAKIGSSGVGNVGSVSVDAVANADIDNYPGFEPMTIAIGA